MDQDTPTLMRIICKPTEKLDFGFGLAIPLSLINRCVMLATPKRPSVKEATR